MDQTFIGINLSSQQGLLCIYSKLVYNKSHLQTLYIDDLALPLIINPNEKITRVLRMIEVNQNGLCVSCKGRITCDHAVVSSGKPRHKYCAIKHHIISAVIHNKMDL